MTILYGDGQGQFTIVGGMSDPKGAIGDANGDGVLDFRATFGFGVRSCFTSTVAS